MAEKLDEFEKRIRDLEQRLLRLESGARLEGVLKSVKEQNIREEEREQPVLGYISVVIGGLILFYSIPNLIFGYGRFDIFGLMAVFVGAAFGWAGFKTIQRYRVKAAAPKESVKTVTSESRVWNEVMGDRTQSFEYQIASHWFSVVGIIAIVFGVVFFLKFAFDNNLIGPRGQVSIGIFIGLALIGAGEYFRKKYQKYSQVITGGGILVLYLSLWSSYGLFHLFAAPVVLGGMSLVTLAAALLAVRYQAIHIAVIGLLGGFATPILLVKGLETELLLMSYVLILDLGILLVAVFQNWQKLNILSFAATYLVFISWYSSFYSEQKLLSTFIFLTAVFVVFGFVYFIYNIVNEKKTEDTDVLLLLLNAAVYFGFSYSLLKQDYGDWLGFFALTLAFYYFLLGYLSFHKLKDSPLTLGFLGISILFLTIAVPLQVKKNIITIIWSLEGLVLLGSGFWLNSYKLRMAALAVYLLVAGRLFLFDTQLPLEEFVLFFNRRFITFLAAVLSLGGASWFYYYHKPKVTEDEAKVLPALLIVLNVVLVWALSWESMNYFGEKIQQIERGVVQQKSLKGDIFGNTAIYTQVSDPSDDASVSCSNFSNTEIYFGVDNGCQPSQGIFATFLFKGVVLPKGAIIKGARLYFYAADAYSDQASYKISLKRAAGYLAATPEAGTDFVLWGSGNWQYSAKVVTSDMATQVQRIVNDPGWQGLGSIEAMIEPIGSNSGYRRVFAYEGDPQRAATLEIVHTISEPSPYQFKNYPTPPIVVNEPRAPIDEKSLREIKDLKSVRDVSLSIIWLVYSVILLIVGIVKKYKPIRISALAFFGITIIKVFLYDSRILELSWRIVAFIALGMILLGVSLAYQKYKAKIEAFLLSK